MNGTAVETLREGKQVTDSARVNILLISIGRDQYGAPTGIRVFPDRAADSKIFYPKQVKPWTKTPREIFWVASNLKPGESLVIQAKTGAEALFQGAPLEIKHPQQGVGSGPVIGAMHEPDKHEWPYAIVLQPSGIKLDPVIIIEPDPPGDEP